MCFDASVRSPAAAGAFVFSGYLICLKKTLGLKDEVIWSDIRGGKESMFLSWELIFLFLVRAVSNIFLCDLSRWQFQRHIKKSEGLKIPKVELQISIYGVKILDPKTKVSCCTRQVKLYCQQTWHRDRCNLPPASIQSVNNECGVFVYQDVQHNCQLHRISFCADDKTDKRIFTFICKDSESNKHLCYVFDSEKCVSVFCIFVSSLKQNVWNTVCWLIHLCSYIILWFVCFDCPHSKHHVVNRQWSRLWMSCTVYEVYDQAFAPPPQAEEITLTIGQAFDLAYKKFLESGGKDVETRKQIGSLQKRVCSSLDFI